MSRKRGKQRDKGEIEWNFFSFPVAFGFALGALIATLLAPIGLIVFVVSLFGVAFSVTHITGHKLRERQTNKLRDRAEEAEMERRALARRARHEGTASEDDDGAEEEVPPSQQQQRRRRRRGRR